MLLHHHFSVSSLRVPQFPAGRNPGLFTHSVCQPSRGPSTPATFGSPNMAVALFPLTSIKGSTETLGITARGTIKLRLCARAGRCAGRAKRGRQYLKHLPVDIARASGPFSTVSDLLPRDLDSSARSVTKATMRCVDFPRPRIPPSNRASAESIVCASSVSVATGTL